MAEPITGVKYTGSALPGNAETVALFDSLAAGLSDGMLLHTGQRTFGASIDHDQAGTIEGYWSDDNFVTETQFYDSGSLPAPAETDEIRVNISGRRAVRFDWVNGATPQTEFDLQIWLSTEVQP